MLQAGKLITQINDPLIKVQPEYLYHAVKKPKPEIEVMIRQLRLVRTIDENRYRNLKKQLPYVTCGIFNPPFRKTENFGWINHFIVDIDHITEKQLNSDTLRSKLVADPRVKLLFCSPGEDGLKVVFQLAEKCFDAGQYSLFYKLFVKSLSTQYQIEQVIDQRTSDVTRACFVSLDPDAYYNPTPNPVQIATFIDLGNPYEMAALKRGIQKEEKEASSRTEQVIEKVKDPDDDIMAAIKARLNPGKKLVREKQIYVPEEMQNIVNKVMEHIKTYEIETREIIDIHYGKKFRFRLHMKEAEINLFYGKRGFSIVQSPRCGTNPELNELCARILGELLL
ncbi:MAG: CRISPR-associated primase-polymerase type B [Mangrovibacterium sp.]|nr:CRISPR-associated primase-polymerase type B [Mangrovibacterium sp.]